MDEDEGGYCFSLGNAGIEKSSSFLFFFGIVVRRERGVVDVYYQHDTFFLIHWCLSTSPSSPSFPSRSQPAVPPKKSKSIYCPPKVLPNSSPRSAAAFTARSTISAKPEVSKLSKAACVVPLGLVTFFLNCAGDSLPAEVDSTNIFPAPKQVCVARRVAWDSERPRRTELVMRCSTRAKK